ncbi:MAG: FAD-binding oxidoreductase [Armatimonadota bacterium]|nr:FAD-binding oxidoreductase [Armatimonadota bacterium]
MGESVPRSAEVVIVGAGSTGLSIAYHLASLGVRDVVVVDRLGIASGSTGRSAGGIRQQFASEVNVRLSLYSVQAYERFKEEVGQDIDFRQYGYLFLATTPEEVEAFSTNVALQQSLGVPVRLIAKEEAKEIVPQLHVGDVLAATFCPTDGYADPYSVAMGYAAAARRMGVSIVEGVEVTGIKVTRGRVTSVVTGKGEISTHTVINAAGPWAGVIGRMAGVDLPIQPFRRQVFVTGPFDKLPERLPMVIEFRTHFYFRREGPGILFGMTDPDEPPGFHTHVDWAFLEKVLARAVHRVPVFAEASVHRGWAGLYDTTPDDNPILGKIPEVEGFIVAAGFSGHGFMHAPAVGRCIAEIVVFGEAKTVDISSLSYGRFVQGGRGRELYVI